MSHDSLMKKTKKKGEQVLPQHPADGIKFTFLEAMLNIPKQV